MNVLVVEDEKRLARLIERVLREEGHAVTVVQDGRGALELAMEPAFDVIVLDVMLPDLDGFEVCRRLRGRGVTTPVLMLTARGALADRVEGLDVGADDYLVKPFAFPELLARLRALYRRAPPLAAGPVLRVADVELDPATRQVRRAGRPVRLTPREFALLELLMRNVDRVLSREVILDHVWGYGAGVTPNTVDAYIRLLRRKIDRGADRPLIESVRGVGYRLRRV